MAWKLIAAFVAALALVYLGQLTILVSVLSIGVKALIAVLIAVVVGGVAVYLWQQYRKTRRGCDPHKLILKKQ